MHAVPQRQVKARMIKNKNKNKNSAPEELWQGGGVLNTRAGPKMTPHDMGHY